MKPKYEWLTANKLDWFCRMHENGDVTIVDRSSEDPGVSLANSQNPDEMLDVIPLRLIIPSEIEGHRVVGIGDRAFYLTSIWHADIPETVNRVGRSVFPYTFQFECVDGILYCGKWCIRPWDRDVKKAQLRVGTIGIADSAFSGCSNLKSVQLPQGLRYVGAGAFSRSGLSDVLLPKSIEAIYENAFLSTAVDATGFDCKR